MRRNPANWRLFKSTIPTVRRPFLHWNRKRSIAYWSKSPRLSSARYVGAAEHFYKYDIDYKIRHGYIVPWHTALMVPEGL